MKIVLYEMKKSWLRLPMLVIIIAFAVLNIYKLTTVYEISGKMVGDSEQMKNAYFQIYDNILSGEINAEKINYVSEKYKETSSEIAKGNFSTDYDSTRLTGYAFSDNILFESFFVPELEYVITYPNLSNEVSARAYENISFYTQRNNNKEVQKNTYIFNQYKNREIKNYNLTEWVKIFFEYDFSSLLIIILIVIALSPSISIEYESGMRVLISASRSDSRIINAKLISTAVFIFGVTLFFTLVDFFTIKALCRADGLLNPIYSAEIFKYSPFNFSFLCGIAVCCVVKMLAFFLIGEIIILISRITKNTILSLCGSFAMIVAMIFLAEKSSTLINPVNVISTYKLLESFDSVVIFGNAVPILYWSMAVYLLMNIFLITVIKLCIVKGSVHNVKMGTEKAAF